MMKICFTQVSVPRTISSRFTFIFVKKTVLTSTRRLQRNEGAVTESYGPPKKNFTIKVVIPAKFPSANTKCSHFFISPSQNTGRVIKCAMAAFMKIVFVVLNTKSKFVH